MEKSSTMPYRLPTGAVARLPVGLLFAGSATSTIANPIKTVLAQLGGLTFDAAAPTAAEIAAARQVTPDPRVEAVSRIKDRYDDFLFGLPEVVGHGVAYSRDGSGEVVIRTYLAARAGGVVYNGATAVWEG